ncbi:hypothetical protein PPBDW_p0085 (plasmid) [Photobacterium kishitanii]|nr:hypothetical protein PPBDW_p0085 [Photobacterium kishitanii]
MSFLLKTIGTQWVYLSISTDYQNETSANYENKLLSKNLSQRAKINDQNPS